MYPCRPVTHHIEPSVGSASRNQLCRSQPAGREPESGGTGACVPPIRPMCCGSSWLRTAAVLVSMALMATV
ncbi:hypothetical protein EYF80_034712 [Liparis tanakae]|uniref:Uncharacterized protein n=1 Tax=Liparis tanakae TaxID=230148 RepID=A0A4Z2GQN3_9TELE|nr:hypothetical protein EYF80_034712 [Liparis tanakae]